MQADPAAAATVGKLVLSYTGEDLDLKMRMERSRRRPPLDEATAPNISSVDIESATGPWNVSSIWLRFKNFFAVTLPPWPEAIPAQLSSPPMQRISLPIASAALVTFHYGEALNDLETAGGQESPIQSSLPFGFVSKSLDSERYFRMWLCRLHASLVFSRGSFTKFSRLSPADDVLVSETFIRNTEGSPSSLHRRLLRQGSHSRKPAPVLNSAGFLRNIVERMNAAPGLLRDRIQGNGRYLRAVEAGEFVSWAIKEKLCENAVGGRELGTALLKEGLIRRVDWAPVFVDPAAGGSHHLYQLRAKPNEIATDGSLNNAVQRDGVVWDQWSNEWGNTRPGRLAEENQEGLVGPLFKLRFQSLRLQWTQESREAMTDWLTQFSLATQPASPAENARKASGHTMSPHNGPDASYEQHVSIPAHDDTREESLIQYLKRTANGEAPTGVASNQGDACRTNMSSWNIAWVIEVHD